MLQPKSLHQVIDYRNARYQGRVDEGGNRHELGVLIDDDLSFYVSHWHSNMLNGQTLVYISHGKYIYGQWLNNQPHGLNVFRTGDTVLVGQFQNGQIFGKMLVIFQRYNIIAILQIKSSLQKIQVVQCGKLCSHDDLLKYIQMLDNQMPDNYFSLIKFVTSLTSSEQNDDDQCLIASPSQNQNCYFGYRDGLAIVFNSNNGVVSVGQHQDKKISTYGGIFDGKKIQQGNFDLKQTISYQKKRPNNQVNAIFQKMHKRSLHFKNQYFDSKVKTLKNLQEILRENIQKIVNYNTKNKIHSASEGDLNDSLDYNNIDQFQSEKTAQNRQVMYERQGLNLKKVVSQYSKQQNPTQYPSRVKSSVSENIQKNQSKISVASSYHKQQDEEQYLRMTPTKVSKQSQSSVYYAKKSPIRYKQDDQKRYKDSLVREDIETQSRQQKSAKISSNYSNLHERDKNQSKSPLRIAKKTSKRKPLNQQLYTDIPKFGGLQIQENKKFSPPRKKLQVEVEQYRRQLQKSRSKQKLTRHSISKYLKRPSYEDIQDRRKRILDQFKDLNDPNSTSRLSHISQHRKTVHKASIQIEVSQNSHSHNKTSINQSPCMKEKIMSYTSENQNGTENSGQGYMPLSLVNKQKGRENRAFKASQSSSSNKVSSLSKKQSVFDSMLSGKRDKQNLGQTPTSFSKYKRDTENLSIGEYTRQKDTVNKILKIRNQQGGINMSKNISFQRKIGQNQQQEQNKFQQIQIKYKGTEHERSYNERSQNARNQDERNQDQRTQDRRSHNQGARDRLTAASDISNRRKSYRYYFQE